MCVYCVKVIMENVPFHLETDSVNEFRQQNLTLGKERKVKRRPRLFIGKPLLR